MLTLPKPLGIVIMHRKFCFPALTEDCEAEARCEAKI
jgi:hypothetical protein